MSIPAFDSPQLKLLYGNLGQETARKMVDVLKAHSLSITYNEGNEKFTIHGSSGIEKKFIEKIFNEQPYVGWRPQVLRETDRMGNRLVRLQFINESNNQSISSLFSKKLAGRDKR